MASKIPLDTFGALISKSLRDAALHRAEALLTSSLKSPRTQVLQLQLQLLPLEQRETLRVFVRNAIDAGIHDFLLKLQELSDTTGSVKVMVDGENVASLSDGLHGEAYSEQGWFSRFSSFPSA